MLSSPFRPHRSTVDTTLTDLERNRNTRAVELVKLAIYRENMKRPDVARMLEIDSSHLFRILSGERPFGEDTRVRILKSWRSLGLRPEELLDLQGIWHEQAEAARNKYTFEVPSVLFAAVAIIAREAGFFLDPTRPDIRLNVAWENGRREPLTGGLIVQRVAQQGYTHFGIAYESLLAPHSAVISPLIRLGLSSQIRILVAKDVYDAVRSEAAQQHHPLPTFADIVRHVHSQGGRLYLNNQTAVPSFIHWLAKTTGLESELRGLCARATELDLTAPLEWIDDASLIATWPPIPFLFTDLCPPLGPERRFIELSTPFCELHNGGQPQFDRNRGFREDIYHLNTEFRESAVVFTRCEVERNEPDVCRILYRGLDQALLELEAARTDTAIMERNVVRVIEPLWSMVRRNEPYDEASERGRAFRAYVEAELKELRPYLHICVRHADLLTGYGAALSPRGGEVR